MRRARPVSARFQRLLVDKSVDIDHILQSVSGGSRVRLDQQTRTPFLMTTNISAVRTVSCEEAQRLVEEGYQYIDVRNEREFEQWHPACAYNVPLTQMTDFGPEPNEFFVETINRHFGPEAKLVIGCGLGATSRRAANLLAQAGYSDLVDVREGYNGCRDAFGRKSPGWLERGLPVEFGQPELRSFEALAEPLRK